MANVIKSFFRALRPIKHDGKTYAAGTKVELTEEQANHLGASAVVPHVAPLTEMSADELAAATKDAREREKAAAAAKTAAEKAAADKAATDKAAGTQS